MYLLLETPILPDDLFNLIHLGPHDLPLLLLELGPVECLSPLLVHHDLLPLLDLVHPLEVVLPQPQLQVLLLDNVLKRYYLVLLFYKLLLQQRWNNLQHWCVCDRQSCLVV